MKTLGAEEKKKKEFQLKAKVFPFKQRACKSSEVETTNWTEYLSVHFSVDRLSLA